MSGAQLGWAVEAMIASALLMALVLLARGYVRRAFGPQVAYALWALPLLRLVLPPLPRGLSEQATPPLAAASERFTTYVMVPMAEQLPAPLAAPSLWPMVAQAVALVWIVGAGGFLGFQLLRHWRFRTRLLATAETLDAVKGVRVVASDGAPGPLAFGIWHRYVAFPRDFAERYDADERDLALAHELGHHARGDLIANWIALGVLALHWFNPLAWRAFHAFRADQELANDARVLKGRSRADRHVYACAIVKAAHGRALSGACHLHTIEDLKGRLKMLTTSPTSRRQLVAGGASVSLLVLAGLGLTASGTPAAAALTERVERTIGVDLTSTAAVLPAVAQTAPELSDPPTASSAPIAPVVTARPAVAIAATPPGPPAIPAVPTTSPAVEPPAAPQAPAVPRIRVVTLRNGHKVRIFDRNAVVPMVPMPPMPVVQSRSCGTSGSDSRTSYTTVDGETRRQVTIICTDRIEQSARLASLSALNAQRSAQTNMRIALASIESARASINRDRNLSEDARRDALKGLNEATAELKAEMANRDAD
ncbi:M56 family metallopeptidase [Sphingomonas sp. NCPPB 2930]|uniref:M56 family metallopeptidase n=1 Tax=Sphingomonas sp. NCPPB 2930 TaxID=3162788 RepID=UPI0036D8A270